MESANRMKVSFSFNLMQPRVMEVLVTFKVFLLRGEIAFSKKTSCMTARALPGAHETKDRPVGRSLAYLMKALWCCQFGQCYFLMRPNIILAVGVKV